MYNTVYNVYTNKLLSLNHWHWCGHGWRQRAYDDWAQAQPKPGPGPARPRDYLGCLKRLPLPGTQSTDESYWVAASPKTTTSWPQSRFLRARHGGALNRHTFDVLLIVPERLWGNEFTKIILNGSPRGRFEHSGVLPGAKLHAEHDGNSEINSW